jgi:hypothetical protein
VYIGGVSWTKYYHCTKVKKGNEVMPKCKG